MASPLDMKKGTICYGAPEFRLTNSAFADIYHYYGLPIWSTVGSDAHCLDAQASMEHAFSTLMAALDGANLIHDVGYLGQGLLSNPAAIVMCSEVISYVKRIIRGFDITREKLALDVIRDVGPGGHFLTISHTRDHFQEEIVVVPAVPEIHSCERNEGYPRSNQSLELLDGFIVIDEKLAGPFRKLRGIHLHHHVFRAHGPELDNLIRVEVVADNCARIPVQEPSMKRLGGPPNPPDGIDVDQRSG